ncbi:P-loop containing nucleoside triphosphate hydrolase protein [Zychaea mexicana]|uniref:P-loop containing nucleoside triphosphate hydrolase protein n=1 Tax=Zychaea mexicana TaxID=64656 RepID=UPI0022FE4009|nr:P-loop containing nucleoside triphosphate hydrolase protein [Zychaea mexicana]KAI9499410.1 P-loop containing nucleoside triphosphate hydrolase protein [Zychaea mexicana]
MITQVLRTQGSRLQRSARSVRLVPATHRNAYHHLGANSGSTTTTTTTTASSYSYSGQRMIPLLQHSPRVRFFSHVAPTMVLHNHQVRSIAFSSVPRMALSALRLPTLVAGTTVAGVTLANNKITDWTDKGTEFVLDGVKGAKKFLGALQEQAEELDVSIPEIHLQVPSVIKDFLASMAATEEEPHTTNHTFSKTEQETEKESNNKNDGGGGGDGGGDNKGTAAAAAAAVAAYLNDDEEEEKPKKKRKQQHDVSTHQDEQLMMLTKKLIEIRSILLSIDHNETLKLPSIVVVGSQSSGKSSVLEAIVGHEFLPKGSNMVTRRPIELTLIHTPGEDEEYGEFPQLGLGKMNDFKKIQKTLVDMNMAVSDTECVSEQPIELRVYSPNVPDLTLIDLPGYIQISNKNQPETLKTKIEDLCEKYIRGPNIILAVCAANVDLANSPALRASRKCDPLGLRTIGVITKMDLVPPEHGAGVLRNADYPLHLGYIGVVCRSPENVTGNMTSALIRNEEAFFQNHLIYNQRDIQVGTATLRHKLMNVLEQSMGRSLYSIVDAVQQELEEARYQFKVQYNDRRVTAESYVAETIDSLKHNFKDFATRFGKPQVRHEVRTMLEQRVLDICAEHYWSDPKIAELPKASLDDIYWLYKVDLASSALTKSGIGRSTTQLVVDVLMSNMERLANADPFSYHPETRKQVMSFTSEILRSKFLTTSDQVENTIKPYKYEVEVTDMEWSDGVKRAVTLLEQELDMCDQMTNSLKNAVGKKKLKSAIKYLLDQEREDGRRQERLRQIAEEGGQATEEQLFGLDDEDAIKPFYNAKILEKAKDALFLRDRAMILKYRIAALKSRQCKSADNKQYCPEAFLNVIAEKLTYTAVMFIQVELLNEFFFQFPREVDNRLVYQMNRRQILQFARENPPIQKHLDLQERKNKLEDVMDKLSYLVKRQADRQARAKMSSFSA